MQDVALATLIKDPKGVFLKPLNDFLPVLKRMYADIVVVAARDVHRDIIRGFVKHNCIVKVQEKNGIAEARRQAVRDGFVNGCRHIHFCEIDRVLHWVNRYPEELRNVMRQIPNYDFLIIGRTQRALGTHPRTQTETERLVNTVCSLLLRRDTDVCSASRGISREAAKLILQYSKAEGISTDTEWPIIIHCRSKMSSGYIQAEGMEFETAIKHLKEIEEAGGFEKWKKQIEQTPQIWVHRIKFCYQTAKTAINTFQELSTHQHV